MPGFGGKAIAVGATAVLGLGSLAQGNAWASDPANDRALPDLPWSITAGAVEAIDFLATPIMGVGDALVDASEWAPPLAPVGHVVGLVGQGLPVTADALRLIDRVAHVDVDFDAVSQPGQPASWQLPELPLFEGEVSAVSSGVGLMMDRLIETAECECLPFGLDERLQAGLPQAIDASNALDTYSPLVSVINQLTGYEGPRTYLMVIGNQAEMRPSGGAPLYAVLITADNGRITLADKGLTSTHFFPPMNRPVTWTSEKDNPYFRDNPRTEPFVNAGRHPDFSISGAEMAAAFQAGGYPAIDGVIYIDMTFLEGLMELTGPLSVEGMGVVDSTNLAIQLLDNAYDETDSKAANAKRQEANDRLVETLLDRLQRGLPALPTLDRLSEATDGRHLQVWFRDSATQSVFDELSWTGRLVAPTDADWLAWYTQSGNPSKTDIQQYRSVVREVVVEGSQARVSTDFVITNANEPNDDPTIDERRGYQATWMRTATVIYLPPGATDVQVLGLENAEVAPLPAVRRSADLLIDASGQRFLRFAGWIPPLERASIRVAYSLELDDDTSYSVVMEPQAAFTAYEATVNVRGSLGDERMGPLPVEEQTVLTFP